jgi:ATP-binding cassette subfamily C (CFTR/MRP) protein 1
LDPFGLYSDEEIWKSLELSYLANHIRSLDGNLDYEVTEGGSNFSIGQRQLICLARALLRRSKIILMDEATSSVSRDIGNLIQSTINDQFRNCTVFTIAHRLETVMESDTIFVLENGTLAESGNPDSLLKDSSSMFFSLVQSMKLEDE